jgi:hypothetical protein
MKYVSPELLAKSLSALHDYSTTKGERLKGLFGVLVLKHQSVGHGAPKKLSVPDFDSVCLPYLRVVQQGDPAASYGEKLYNPFGDEPIVRDSWPRSTLYTRLPTNQYWNDIVQYDPAAGWKFGPEYPAGVAKRILKNDPVPAFALAAFLFRRPTDLDDAVNFSTHAKLVDAFKANFHIAGPDGVLFDFGIPSWATPLQDTEMTREEVIRVASAAPGASKLAVLLAAEAGAGGVERSDEIVACALKMGQVLLFGPPGTGKSYWAEKAALRLTGHARLDQAVAAGLVSVMIWHPSTTYEDFLGGVTVVKGTIEPKPGVFRKFCEDAEKDLRPRVFLIDEINRGNTVAVLGELLYGLELDKRNKPVTLADQTKFVIPPHIYVIATANTADRSIAALDVALGRRFARVEIPPEPNLLGDAKILGIELQSFLQTLNRRIMDHVDREHRIGHSYLMDSDGHAFKAFEDLVFALKYRIIPLLQDYALDDFEMLQEILGSGFVDVDEQRIKIEAFLTETALQSALTSLMTP